MIELIGNVSVADWWTTKKFQVDETKIFGFEIHYFSGWHIHVSSKVKCKCKKSDVYPEGYYYDDYSIGECVSPWEIVELLTNPKANVLSLTVEYPKYCEAQRALEWVMNEVKKCNKVFEK